MQRFFCRCLYPQKPQAWLRTIHLLIPPDLADQQYRVWVVDSAMCLENPENFTHNHNRHMGRFSCTSAAACPAAHRSFES